MAEGSPSRWEQLTAEAEQAIRANHYELAERLYAEAAAKAENEFGRADERLVATLQTLAHTQYCYLGSYARSEPTARKLLEVREEVLGADHPNVAESWIFVAQALEIGQERFEDAEQAYRRALEIAERALGADNPELAGPVHQLGQFYRNRGRYAEAEPLMQRLVNLQAQDPDVSPLERVAGLGEHAGVLEKLGHNPEAEARHRQILAIREQLAATNKDHMSLGLTELQIAKLSAARGDDGEAEIWYERALAAFDSHSRHFAQYRATTGSDVATDVEAPVAALVLRQILIGYAALLRRRGANAEAEALEDRESRFKKN